MKTTTDKHHTWLLRRFHTLCSRLGLASYTKIAMIESYGVTSSRDLNCQQLEELCKKLEFELNPELRSLDEWRKRVMASIGGWLRQTGHEQNAQLIKSIACRATGSDSYNCIPKERLINIYYAFLNKQKDFSAVDRYTEDELEILQYSN
jgi:hypothetical protein